MNRCNLKVSGLPVQRLKKSHPDAIKLLLKVVEVGVHHKNTYHLLPSADLVTF